MKKESSILRKLLLMFLLTCLFIPLIQYELNIVVVSPLKGGITTEVDSNFSMVSWFSGSYQEQKEKYLNESFGFRNIMVRLNNQLAFWLFNKAKANGVIIGKENYLYEENYIKAYYGEDFVGKDIIDRQMAELKFVSDTLKKLHKNIILVFAAGKGSFYPEYFPEGFKRKKNITNLETYVKAAQDRGLNYIDFNAYFVANKKKSKYPLYPKYGIHWSNYGECLVSDSLIKYIESLRHVHMLDIYWDSVQMLPANGDDVDVLNGMNLLFKLKLDSLGYPDIKYETDTTKAKPKVVVISDSFFWGMYNFDFCRVFSHSQFWYYNKQVYPESFKSPFGTEQVNLKDAIAQHDIFIIMATDANLPNLGWGIIEELYSTFKGTAPKH